jgi:hypothetical protein
MISSLPTAIGALAGILLFICVLALVYLSALWWYARPLFRYFDQYEQVTGTELPYPQKVEAYKDFCQSGRIPSLPTRK